MNEGYSESDTIRQLSSNKSVLKGFTSRNNETINLEQSDLL